MRRFVLIIASCAVSFCAAEPARGHEHAFPPPAYAMHTSGQVYIFPYPIPAAHGIAAPKTTYAYGWFGVVPRCHKSHHHGYYNNYYECRER